METHQIIITCLGGLAVFIFGMNMMSDGLQKSAGDKMRNILALLTRNPIIGVLAGALATAVLQSSSATTVMVIGFVSAGLMKLPQAISVIMGANIGTTITAQLIAFKIGDYAWAIVFIGFVMYFFLVRFEKVKDIGQVLFGFGLLFIGINTMGDVMKPLAELPVFVDMMQQVQDVPILGVAVGTLMTVLVQSSSATIAVLQNLASTAGPDGVTSILGLEGAIPILFGDNIGTTITALLASIGQSINAKRTALSHVIFNLTGTLLFIWFIPQIVQFVTFISPSGPELEVIARQIANTHTFFNITITVLWLPFIFVLVKIVTKLIPGKDLEKLPSEPAYLDFHVVDRPTFALHLAFKEIFRIGEIAERMVRRSRQALLEKDESAIKEVFEDEDNLNILQKKTADYLAAILATDNTTETQKERISGMLHIVSDIEHIGDSCENLVELAQERTKEKYDLSNKACAEIYECYDLGLKMVTESLVALETGNEDIAFRVKSYEKEMDKMEEDLRKQHMKRVNDNICAPAATVIYTEIIHNIENIGDYCENIADAVIADTHFKDVKLPDDEE